MGGCPWGTQLGVPCLPCLVPDPRAETSRRRGGMGRGCWGGPWLVGPLTLAAPCASSQQGLSPSPTPLCPGCLGRGRSLVWVPPESPSQVILATVGSLRQHPWVSVCCPGMRCAARPHLLWGWCLHPRRCPHMLPPSPLTDPPEPVPSARPFISMSEPPCSEGPPSPSSCASATGGPCPQKGVGGCRHLHPQTPLVTRGRDWGHGARTQH